MEQCINAVGWYVCSVGRGVSGVPNRKGFETVWLAPHDGNKLRRDEEVTTEACEHMGGRIIYTGNRERHARRSAATEKQAAKRVSVDETNTIAH